MLWFFCPAPLLFQIHETHNNPQSVIHAHVHTHTHTCILTLYPVSSIYKYIYCMIGLFCSCWVLNKHCYVWIGIFLSFYLITKFSFFQIVVILVKLYKLYNIAYSIVMNFQYYYISFNFRFRFNIHDDFDLFLFFYPFISIVYCFGLKINLKKCHNFFWMLNDDEKGMPFCK